MSHVVLRHPDLPAEQTITVAAQAVPHYARSGWQPVDLTQQAPAEPATTEPDAEPDESEE